MPAVPRRRRPDNTAPVTASRFETLLGSLTGTPIRTGRRRVRAGSEPGQTCAARLALRLRRVSSTMGTTEMATIAMSITSTWLRTTSTLPR